MARPWLGGGVALMLAAVALAAALARPIAQRRLSDEPLGAAPFYFAAADQPARAVALLSEARRRDPHDEAIRRGLLSAQLRVGNIAGAMSELAAIQRMAPASADAIIEHVGEGAVKAMTVDKAVEAIRPYPQLIAPFLRGLAHQSGAPLVVRAIDQLPSTRLTDQMVRDSAVAALLSAEQYGRARRLWLAGRADPGAIIDPNLTHINQAGVFGWQSETSAVSAADALPNGGVELTAYGRAPGVMVRQLLTQVPGSYRIGLRYQPIDSAAGLIQARVRCAPAGLILATAELAATGDEQVADFAVRIPTLGCTGQWLELVTPGGGGRAAVARIFRISLAGSRRPSL